MGGGGSTFRAVSGLFVKPLSRVSGLLRFSGSFGLAGPRVGGAAVHCNAGFEDLRVKARRP